MKLLSLITDGKSAMRSHLIMELYISLKICGKSAMGWDLISSWNSLCMKIDGKNAMRSHLIMKLLSLITDGKTENP